jgi:hypothetical protein
MKVGRVTTRLTCKHEIEVMHDPALSNGWTAMAPCIKMLGLPLREEINLRRYYLLAWPRQLG